MHALLILLSGVYTLGFEGDGLVLTQNALPAVVGDWGCTFIGVGLVLFVFTSILYNYYLDENNLRFLLGDKRAAVIVYRCLVLLLILWSTEQYLGKVFAFADITMTLLAFFNLIAWCCCSTSACACCVTMTGSAGRHQDDDLRLQPVHGS